MAVTELVAPPGYKAEHVAVVGEHIRPGARVVEVGAGLGVVTAALACRCSYVLGCEPVPRLHAAAYDRLVGAAAAALSWSLVQAAVGSAGCADVVELHEMSEPWNSGAHVPFYDTPVRTFTCAQVELDVLVRAVRADTVVLDCEGAECDLLTGCELGPLRTLMVEWHPHIVGAAAVEATKRHVLGEGFAPVVEVHGELRPGGFAELVVYRREP